MSTMPNHSPQPTAPNNSRRNRYLAGGAGLLLVAGVAGGALAARGGSGPSPDAPKQSPTPEQVLPSSDLNNMIPDHLFKDGDAETSPTASPTETPKQVLPTSDLNNMVPDQLYHDPSSK